MSQEPHTQRVLIVDDVPANIKVLLPTLQPYYEISIATHGQQALSLALSQKPDLILLDIIMPGMDGYEVCRQLKANEQTCEIPVIFITAKDDEADEMTGLELGAVDYITKPFSAAIVHARTKTHLGLKNAREEIKQKNQALVKAAALQEDVNRIMRHDLKTPLNAVIGFSDLLLSREACRACDPEYISLLELIRESGYRLLEMVNISLDLYKMEQGTYIFEPKAVDIRVIIHKIFQTLQDRTAAKKLSVTVRAAVAEGEVLPFMVLGEELLCYSLLANLIKNAVEAAPRGSVIHVFLEKADEMGIIAIHNEGAVPSAIVDRFFEKYATSGKSGGTGLGTYSSQLIAKTQHGDITMTTSVEAGTTLRVALPQADPV